MGYHYDPILCMNVPNATSKAKDAMQFVQLRFSSGRTEGAKLDESEYKEYAESLLKLYGEKQVTISKNGRAIATYINRGGHDSMDKALRTCDDDKVVGYREISMETRRAKVGDVEVYMGDTGSEIVDFTVNWPSIGYVTPDKALSFARDLMKAANNAKKLEQKYKGYKIKF